MLPSGRSGTETCPKPRDPSGPFATGSVSEGRAPGGGPGRR